MRYFLPQIVCIKLLLFADLKIVSPIMADVDNVAGVVLQYPVNEPPSNEYVESVPDIEILFGVINPLAVCVDKLFKLLNIDNSV